MSLTYWNEKYEEKLKECPICYNRIYSSEKAILKCEHTLHKECLGKWAGEPKKEIDKRKGCPICRGVLELKIEKGMIRRGKE